MRNTILLALSVCLSVSCSSQKKQVTLQPTNGHSRFESATHELPAFGGIEAASIGPTIMSGRVTDIAVNPQDPTEFYVAYASGGLWYTNSNGASFSPVGDVLPTMTIGDIDVTWTVPHTIVLGSGENNSSRSSYSGLGVFISRDGGLNWENAGLLDSHHIGRVSIHPLDNKNICIGSMGPLYSEGGQKGIYISEDGGSTWKNTLQNLSIIDLVRDPANPDHLFAATWERSRKAWNFIESGKSSAIWESTDNGATWKNITSNNGFPTGEGCGRIGLGIYNGSKGFHLYALVDNQSRRPAEKDDETNILAKQDFLEMTKSTFLELDTAQLSTFLSDNEFPSEYSAKTIMEMVASDKIKPSALYDYLFDANNDLFNTPVVGPELYRFNISEQRWNRTHEGYIDDLCYSYGYYFGVITVNPADPHSIYIAGVPLLTSDDGGVSWKSIQQENQHVDHHVVWVNPMKSGHLINGNDGGINITYNNGEAWFKCNTPAVGQFYSVAVDNAMPYRVYGGLQDNGVWRGPSDYRHSTEWHQSGRYPYEFLMGGDGMQVAIDPRDNETVYTGYQFGHYYRLKEGTEGHYFHPHHLLGQRPHRWNWETPIHLSKHNADILYMASNKFHRSLDRGETWETLSEDLTDGIIAGDVPFGTSTIVVESPLRYGRIYIGTDDGNVHITNDGGYNFKKINSGLPDLWVSDIEPSNHNSDLVYITLNGYRYDHFEPYVYASSNLGTAWTAISGNLPKEAINCIEEDETNDQILYVGTDGGLYISIDGGKAYHRITAMPRVAVHDIVIQEREGDLIVATHGRSLYRISLKALRTFAKNPNELEITHIPTIKHNEKWGSKSNIYTPEKTPKVILSINAPLEGKGTLEVSDSTGTVVAFRELDFAVGPNSIDFDMQIDADKVDSEMTVSKNGKSYLGKGRYAITIASGTKETRGELIVE